ncbi:MAG: NUDIX domain-containing protein [Lachnospiraceae bacterium]|nr:NUDIX domain-containing protein [Lachnospiraceae bacterium]MBO5098377.1 NUDIX domain-containing protein [Agathobacter sp.]
MELIDIVDENGLPTGETIDRTDAHRTGTRHRTTHIWIVRRREGRVQILLQKRAKYKDSFPGCYDISSAGHIPAGVDFIPSGLRELQEELNIVIDPAELIECGLHRTFAQKEFHGHPYVDNQVAKVFLLWKDMEICDMTLQEEEIESVMWMDFEECKDAVRNRTIPHCIDIAELEMLEEHM